MRAIYVLYIYTDDVNNTVVVDMGAVISNNTENL